MQKILIYSSSKIWEIIFFYTKSLAIGILLVGTIYLMHTFIFDKLKEKDDKGSSTNFIIYIIESICIMALIFILYEIFGYHYLMLGILLVVFLFLLSYYSIPIAFGKIKLWWLQKKYSMQAAFFSVAIMGDELKTGEIKRDILNRLNKYKGTIKTAKPKISIIGRSELGEKKFILIYIEVWIKNGNNNQENKHFIEDFISENADYMTDIEYNEHTFHVEQ